MSNYSQIYYVQINGERSGECDEVIGKELDLNKDFK